MIVLLLGGLTGCGWATSAQLGDLSVHELSMEGLSGELAVEVDNPWPVSSEVTADWALDVRDEVLAHGEAGPTVIAASESTTLRLPVQLGWQELWAAAGGAGQPTPYRATVQVTGTSPLGAWTVPVVYEGELPAVRLPELSGLGIAVDEVSLARLRLRLLASTDVPIEALAWHVRLGSEAVAHGTLARADGRVELPVVFELSRGLAALRTVLDRGAEASLTGQVDTPLGPLPLAYQRTWDVAAALGVASATAAD